MHDEPNKKADANTLIDEAADEPTLDEYMRRDPADVSDDDLAKIVELHRAQRAAFIKADAAKKEKSDE